MKKYLAVFTAPIESYDRMKDDAKNKSPEAAATEMKEWEEWMTKHKDVVVDPGAPVGSAKRVTEDGSVTDVRNTTGGYMIVQAESHDEAARIFTDAPHMGLEGSGIEVMEIVPM